MTDKGVYKRDQVVGIINSVLGKMTTPIAASVHETLTHELTQLRDIIENLRTQLHATQANDIGSTHIPTATDELDAVVGTTEQATQTIMGSCEEILENIKGHGPESAKPIETAVVKIFEACTFQDITGQRIKKVVACLKEIEAKTDSILKAIEGEIGDVTSQNNNIENKVVNLLNGPALPQAAVTQDDIDKLLAEFDNNNA